MVDALAGLPVLNADRTYMTGVYDTAGLGRIDGTAGRGTTAVADAGRPGNDAMPCRCPPPTGSPAWRNRST